MNTIDCSSLETLIENDIPIDVIDIRPVPEFNHAHIPGSRSVPLGVLGQPRIVPGRLQFGDPVCIIADDRVSGSLAAGIVRASAGVNAAVLDTGMEGWTQIGLPVVGKRSFWDIRKVLKMVAMVVAVVAGITLALKETIVSILLMAIAVALFLKSEARAGKALRSGARRSHWFSWHGLGSAGRATAH